LANVVYELGRLDEALALYEQASREIVEKDVPSLFGERDLLIRAAIAYGRGNACWDSNRRSEARQLFADCFKLIDQSGEAAESPFTNAEHAWMLLTCPIAAPDHVSRGLNLAQSAVENLPAEITDPMDSPGLCQTVLGMARFRTGDWQAAAESLAKSVEMKTRIDHVDHLFLSMSLWQLGRLDESRRLYDEASQWVEKHKPADPQLKRFLLEAAALIGKAATGSGN
jgi:tetratricopeptide (TPR) repeat protein